MGSSHSGLWVSGANAFAGKLAHLPLCLTEPLQHCPTVRKVSSGLLLIQNLEGMMSQEAEFKSARPHGHKPPINTFSRVPAPWWVLRKTWSAKHGLEPVYKICAETGCRKTSVTQPGLALLHLLSAFHSASARSVAWWFPWLVF